MIVDKFFRRLLPILLLMLICFSADVFSQSNALRNGQQAFRQGEYAEAIEYLRSALAKDSLNVTTYILLSNAYLKLDNGVLAEMIASKGLEQYPENISLKWLKAEGLLGQRQLHPARNIYEDVHQTLQFADQDEERRLISLDRIRNRLGSIHQAQGIQSIQQGDTVAALDHFRQSRNFMPDTLAVYQNLAYTLLALKKYDEAAAAAVSGLARYPGEMPLLQIQATALYRMEKYDALLTVYDRLYEKNPDNVDIALAYGEVMLANKQFLQAQEHFNQLLKEHPKNRKVYRTVIQLNERNLDLEGKLNVLRQMRREFPADTAVVHDMAETLEMMENFQEARAMYDTLGTMSGDTLQTGLSIAKTFKKQDSLTAATQKYSELADYYPENIQLLREYGEVLIEQAAWKKALAIYNRVNDLYSGADVFQNLGYIHEHLGQLETARTFYNRAIESGTDHPLPFYRLAILLKGMGEEKKAFQHIKNAIILALDNLRELQEKVQSQMQSEEGVAGIEEPYEQEQLLHEYNSLSEEIFRYLSRNFPFDTTEPLVQNLLDEYSESPRLNYFVGRFYRIHARSEKSFKHFTKAVQLSPHLEEGHLALGEYHYSQGHIDEAIRSYQRVVSINPRNAGAYDHLIDLHQCEKKLDNLCDVWMSRYRANRRNEVLKEHLVEALHKAGRYEDAQQIVAQN